MQGSLASRGTFGGTEQLVETQQPKTLVLVLPMMLALVFFSLSPSLPLCPSLFFCIHSSPLSYNTESSEGSPPHGLSVFFPV